MLLIREFQRFSVHQGMTQDVAMIVEALRESSILEVRPDGIAVRTKENPTIWPINRAQEDGAEPVVSFHFLRAVRPWAIISVFWVGVGLIF